MTDMEFDAMLKRAVLEAAESDYMKSEEESSPAELSSKYERRFRKMLKDPVAYVKRLRKPVYLRILETAAAVLLVVSTLFGLLMLNPTVRATFSAIMNKNLDDRNLYRLMEEADTVLPDSVTLGYVPDGYELESEKYDENSIDIIYSSETGELLYLILIDNIGLLQIDNEHYKIKETTIENYTVKIYETTNDKLSNKLICYDENTNLIISLDGYLSISQLKKVLLGLSY